MSLAPPVLGYRKPYPDHYDAIPFPKGYQRPTFDKFDGIGSPQEHLAHFYSACGETSRMDAFLVRQFVQSLKGSAFTWYTQLQLGSIHTWDDMQREFLAQFVSSKKIVSIIDLADTKQKATEGANDFITRWRSLNLQCPEKLSEQSAVQMCANNLIPEIATFVGTAEPQTFDALVSKANNVERQIARQKTSHNAQAMEKKNGPKKSTVKKGETMATFIKSDKKNGNNSNNSNNNNNNNKGKDERPRRLSLKERKSVKYSFDDDDVDSIFDELLAAKVVKLPESKRPAEVNKTDNPKYCRYHRLVSHTLKDCYVLKDIIQEMINNNEIEVETPSRKIATANVVEEKITPTVLSPNVAISVAFEVDNEVTIVQAYPDMPRSRNSNIPTLYELMTAPSFDVWEDFDDDDAHESGDEWKTLDKKFKHHPLTRPHTMGSARLPSSRFRGGPSLKNKKRRNMPKKTQAPREDEYKQPPRFLITLREFLPEELLENDPKKEDNEEVFQCCMVTIETPTASDTEADDESSKPEVDQVELLSSLANPSASVKEGKSLSVNPKKLKAKNEQRKSTDKTSTPSDKFEPPQKSSILSHLQCIPTLFSVHDALHMSRELREALIEALLSQDLYKEDVTEVAMTSPRVCASCRACITFTEEDLMLGHEYHNRPLYVTGLVGNTTINRILLDCGSAVNLLPIKTLHIMGMGAKQLSPSMLTIQGFNQTGQKAMGTIALQMEIGELFSDALFHVIDAPTSFNALLGRPWLHNYGVVPSMLHQCFKWMDDGRAMKVLADIDPFKGEEVNYSDAKFYKPPSITFAQSSDTGAHDSKPETFKPIKQVQVKITTPSVSTSESEKPSNSKVSKPKKTFRYVRKDLREPGQSAITVRDTMEALMTSYARPLRKIDQSIPRRDIVISTTFQDNKSRNKRIVSFGSACSSSTSSDALKIKSRRVNALKVKVQQENGTLKVKVPKSPESELFTDLEKAMFQEGERTESSARISPFQRLGEENPSRVSVFHRLAIETQPRVSVFQRLSISQRSKKRKFKVVMAKQILIPEASDDMGEFASANCVSVEEDPSQNEQSQELIDNAQPAPPQMEDGGQATVDDLQEINLGTIDNPKPIFVSSLLTPNELKDYKVLLEEYRDVFAWGYQDMPGLDPKVAVHKLAVSNEKRWVKQAPRRFRPELTAQLKAEVDKLIDVGFIREVKYPTWLASIVPVKKKNGQIRICIDYRDLNEACPKDEFPVPITELLVDATTGFSALSFMVGFSGYNQIKMAPEDEELTAFRTPKGVYCYTVMPFGLKNAGATYQRAMTFIFSDMLHNTVEYYVDDLVVKSKK